ncbi:ATP-dependent DNA helicase RecQ [Pedobacter sp. Bi27]|uniref:RecQ family ATP-dependent DNA helicase n=1 Tax=Pedobacter sp. Bi27 TaxID=2822351 RepID=UPI001D6D9FB8|nr:RecQ family ATP-dependent DNA helicase [Pedobacter sp. Bi27]CAH0280023.1 ATP-dependent DNA helicase RecQ [Pedobacter sp. Bi27]
MDRNSALELLRKSLQNPVADFREHQWEAIDLVVNQKKKLLVVERTGWGKSSVYFISTKILRDQGKGPTIIISPLLALMRNQIEAAGRLGIRAATINTSNMEDWDEIKQAVLNDNVDALLISPERLANERFVSGFLEQIAGRIGLFVVDEAHCISDWGHDFRTDYRRITNILKMMPDGMPILGTTATANDRVVNDIVSQLGNVEVIRGPLTRESISLQNIVMRDQSERLAWLVENIPNMEGSGIIYTQTIRDAKLVSAYLNTFGINVEAYFSGAEGEEADSNEYRQQLESMLSENRVKALVSTSALGMGYDKPDLGFVVHYQAPGSIIAYYQQVGRAGRNIPNAYCILLFGREDEEIHEYFRGSSFPSTHEVALILENIGENGGMSIPELAQSINLSKGQIEKTIKYISVEDPSPIYKEKTRYLRTAIEYKLDVEKIERLMIQKTDEWLEVKDYIGYNGCLMNYLQQILNDEVIVPCGKCANCLGGAIFPDEADHGLIVNASTFLRHSEFYVPQRKQTNKGALKEYGIPTKIPAELQSEGTWVLSRWGDAGWGKIVADDKHRGFFREELVSAMGEMIRNKIDKRNLPTWVTCVPSKRHPELVPNFAERLAKSLSLPFISCVEKIKDTEPQKEQQNSYFQCVNLDGAFTVDEEIPDGSVLLLDDAIDSGWTFTIIAALLRRAGSGPVYAAALTSTAVN